jgi:hypothetical protein
MQYLPSTRIFDSAPSVPVLVVGIYTNTSPALAIFPRQIKAVVAMSRALLYVEGTTNALPALARYACRRSVPPMLLTQPC